MKKVLFFIMAMMLWGNVAFAQDIEKENRLKLVQEILKNPNEIYLIVDTSIYNHKPFREYSLDSNVLYRAATTILDEFRIKGAVEYVYVKDTIHEVFSEKPNYLGIVSLHEITVQNFKKSRFLNFVFQQIAGKWVFHSINDRRDYFITGYGH